MTNEEKLHLIEDVLELDENTLTPEMALADIEEYDSMSKLSLIVMIDDECNKKLTGEQLREFVTIQDILDFMG
jgi:acyl carrier protein